ncbi:flagellar hook-length control protein FliK [Thiomicrorhabdus indica]|uniref:flagellar hook-length control protein FliK n=1 Tax=Thiomicrorhabdus indica TaxID=2267253 RepID=UPI002AA6BA55|nr:flagellar hook-length control protein FliK [Thiomicrorhabdus indica]
MLQISSTVEKTQAGVLSAAFERVKGNVKEVEENLPDAANGMLLGGKKLSNALGQVLPNERNATTTEQKTLSFSELIKSVLPDSPSLNAKAQQEAVDLQQLASTQIGLGVKGEFGPEMPEQALTNYAQTKFAIDSELEEQELRGQAMAFVQASLQQQSETVGGVRGTKDEFDLHRIDFSETSDEFKKSLKSLLSHYLSEGQRQGESSHEEISPFEGNAEKPTSEISNSAMGFMMSAMAANRDKQPQVEPKESVLSESDFESIGEYIKASVEIAQTTKQQFAQEFQELVESEFGEAPESLREWQKLIEQSLEAIRSEQAEGVEKAKMDSLESVDPEVKNTAPISNSPVTEEQKSIPVEGAVAVVQETLANEEQLDVSSTNPTIAMIDDAEVEAKVEVEAKPSRMGESDQVDQKLVAEQMDDVQAGVTEINESIEQAEVHLAAQAPTYVNASNQQSASNASSSSSGSIDSGRSAVANQMGQSGQQMAGESRQESRQDSRQESGTDNRQNARQDLPAGEAGKGNANANNSETAVSKTASNTQQMAQQLSSLMAQGKSAEMQDKVPVSQMMQSQQKGLEQQANLRAVEASLTQTSMLDSDGVPLTESSSGERRASLPPGLQSIPLPVKHPQWGQALGQRVVYMANSQLQQAQITLNPEKLGPIQIKLHMDRDQQMQVSFSAQHGTTREALEAAIPRLREMLEQNGVNLSSVDVGDFSQFAEEQMSDDSSENQNSGVQTTGSGEEELLTTSEQILQTESDQLVDYYA